MAGGYIKYPYMRNISSGFYYESKFCNIPPLEPFRAGHTVTGLVACGGNGIDGTFVNDTCSKFDTSEGKWRPYATLPFSRKNHMAWQTDDGILLMGGAQQSILIKADGTTELKFELAIHTSRACAVPDDRTSSVYILGGYFRKQVFSNVTRYTKTGPASDLIPNMNFERASLGCAGYYDSNDKVDMDIYFIIPTLR